ncbi:MAG: polysaccharide deacetylase family protein [Rhizobiales bacterium]|nr:polysaccharide deacetylase family protein [Hyphomicrobiales bacterium]
MSGLKNALIRTGLETLYFSGAHMMMRPFVGGVGVILTLHHVRPPRRGRFQPNHLLEISPRFLERVARALRRSRLDLVSLDEMHRRLAQGDFRRRFICLTIDDGYRDTREYAYPILKRHEIPFGIYVATSFADRLGELWWLALEAVIARNVRIGLVIDGRDQRFDCRTVEQKRELFDLVYGWMRSLKTEEELRHVIRDLSARYQVDIGAFCRDLCMSWEELAQLAADPLVTVGAHTVNHVILAKVPAAAAQAEMDMSRSVIEASLGMPAEHLCYPVGDATSAGPREFAIAANLGFKTAVTTRPGVLHRDHQDHLMALPRISVNGDYQQLRYLRVLMSGSATAVWNRFRRVDAA